MRYWKPDLRLGIFCPPETGFVDRFGGLPWGLPRDQWPTCPDCGRPYALLLQLQHHAERLDLGRAGRRLYAFQCSSWPLKCNSAIDNGTALIVEPEEFSDSKTAAPSRLDSWWAPIHVRDWVEREDGVSPENYEKMHYDYDTWLHLAEEEVLKIDTGEKAGGTPSWAQNVEQGPGIGWKMLVQFTDQIKVRGPIPHVDQIGCRVIRGKGNDANSEDPRKIPSEAPMWMWIIREAGDASEYTVGNFNFGMGCAYVFGRNLHTPQPEVVFHWQR